MKTDEKSPQVFMFYIFIEIIIKKGILRIFTIIGTFLQGFTNGLRIV